MCLRICDTISRDAPYSRFRDGLLRRSARRRPSGCRVCVCLGERSGRISKRRSQRGARRWLSARGGSVIALVVLLAIGAVGYQALGVRHAGARDPAHSAGLAAQTAARQARLNEDAAAALAKLATMYDPYSNRATRSWRAANILAAMTEYMQLSGSRAYLPYLAGTYLVHEHDRFVNRFGYYDDEGWWALTWIRAYDLTGDVQYLNVAKFLFAELTRGWTRTCGGGLLWNKFRPYKDAITNELFLAAAAELHTRTPGDRLYRRWAVREWRWFRSSGMLTRSHLVVDGLQQGCGPVLHSPTWTYNQGALIGGLIDLEGVTHQRHLLVLAEEVAGAVMHSRKLSPGGILREPCGAVSACDGNSPTFKGVFAENLKLLYERVGNRSYEAYLLRNAASAWGHDRKGGEFGLSWAGPYDRSDPARQVSAVDLLITQVSAAAPPTSLPPTASRS